MGGIQLRNFYGMELIKLILSKLQALKKVLALNMHKMQLLLVQEPFGEGPFTLHKMLNTHAKITIINAKMERNVLFWQKLS